EDSPYIITTWVTTSILERMARAGGVACVGTLPVGFKYIAHVLRCLEEEGSYTEQGWGRTLHAELEGFLLAAEESYGFLVTPELRDKDATGAALLLAELASLQRDRGETLLDLLDRIHLEHGVVVNTLVSLVMQGANGLERIESIQASLRAEPPSRIAGCPVTAIVDWHDEQRFGPFRSSTDERARNVLCFFLADGTKVTLRPSGTEPKNKTYVEVAGEPLPAGTSLALLEAERSRLRSWAREVADDSVCQAMLRVGITVPEAALRISDLVPLEERLRVVQVVAPRLLKEAYRLEQGETTLDEVRGWLERELRPCGNDPRELVAEGIFAALDRQTIPLRVRELVHNVLEG
ncbi:MAG: hypothetical protein FJ125_10340, partial [Deltaproteobacteria bacterium]|nr:hypothetical protein [Deltaproteobacteria bacterium]